jgi:anaerobic selenocysteine-containing dehydrogenase
MLPDKPWGRDIMAEANRDRVPGYCALCKSRCGCISVVEEGRLVAVEPDPAHPTGKRLCAKGQAAPDIVHSSERLRHPLKRTRPKGEADPGWRRISWDEALDSVAAEMRRLAADLGPEALAFAVTSPSATAMSDHIAWVRRLLHAYGSPNMIFSTEICNWHKDDGTAYTTGAPTGAPDFERAGCIVLWGHNPSTGWLANATAVADAKAAGARLVVVDPRSAGLANKADQWLRVRPGSDGALALGLAGEMIRNGWFDRDFIADWSNGCFLVRGDSGRFLTAADLESGGDGRTYVAWNRDAGAPEVRDPARPDYFVPAKRLALAGRFEVATAAGAVDCRPAFDLYAALAADFTPEAVEAVAGVPAAQVRETARLLWDSRPLAYYAWSGVGQHTNATQTDRAISLLHALSGGYDVPGGNLVLQPVATNDVTGPELMDQAQRAKALGLAARPLGPPKDLWVTSEDFRRAVLQREPYAVRGLIAFGSNLLLSHPDPAATAEALRALEFHVQLDLFMTPTAEFADIVLPVSSPWEHEALRAGFEVSPDGQSLVQLRRAVVAPPGEARSDTRVVFELAKRLGLAENFFGGSLEAGRRHFLAPSGLTLEDLRAAPRGLRVASTQRYRKYAGDGTGPAPGFATPSRRVEIYSQTFLEAGQPPLPAFVEPALSPLSRPDLAEDFPLVLTSAKSPLFCQSQHRGNAALRRRQPDPLIEIHPRAAAARGIAERDWVRIETPKGAVKARAKLNRKLDPGVVCAQHGWWQACEELGLPARPPLGPDSTNYNALIGGDLSDPISGSLPLRSYLCQVSSLAPHAP